MAAGLLPAQHGDDAGYYGDQTSGQVNRDKRQKERGIGRERYAVNDNWVSVQAGLFFYGARFVESFAPSASTSATISASQGQSATAAAVVSATRSFV
jgi:hypothetical protein